MVGRCIPYWNSPFLGGMLVLGRVNIGTKLTNCQNHWWHVPCRIPWGLFRNAFRWGWDRGAEGELKMFQPHHLKGKMRWKVNMFFFCFFFWVKVGWIPSQPIPATGNYSQTDVNIGDVNPPKGKTWASTIFLYTNTTDTTTWQFWLLTFLWDSAGSPAPFFFKGHSAWNGLELVRFSRLEFRHGLYQIIISFSKFASFWNWRPFR